LGVGRAKPSRTTSPTAAVPCTSAAHQLVQTVGSRERVFDAPTRGVDHQNHLGSVSPAHLFGGASAAGASELEREDGSAPRRTRDRDVAAHRLMRSAPAFQLAIRPSGSSRKMA
jgi:hypothetical protein